MDQVKASMLEKLSEMKQAIIREGELEKQLNNEKKKEKEKFRQARIIAANYYTPDLIDQIYEKSVNILKVKDFDPEAYKERFSDIEKISLSDIEFLNDKQEEIQKTETPERPVHIKSGFANELMYLKSKILLKLDKGDEYIDYYIETRRWFSTAEVEFFYKYLEQDVINYSNSDCEVVKKACAEFMNEDVNRIEKFWATIDYSKVAGKDLTKEEREEISKAFRKEHLPDYDNDKIRADLLELEEYKAIERTLYMLK